ncbi:MAG: hypothetical protein CM1200mP21_04230 [Candidatus Poseidoniales archaeon]|nr:MAG: hypothetical protein CM1200mP21_04230 [Candidatus Poseidoniales archaeon]
MAILLISIASPNSLCRGVCGPLANLQPKGPTTEDEPEYDIIVQNDGEKISQSL